MSISGFMKKQDTLEKKLYWIILIISTIVAIISAGLTIIEKISWYAAATANVAMLFFIGMIIYSYRHEYKSAQYSIMCLVLNLFIMPVNFIACGGLDCGMPLYFLITIFPIAPGIKGKKRLFTFFTSFAVMLGFMIYAEINPKIVLPISEAGGHFDIILTFGITGLSLYFMTVNIIASYEKEKLKNEELLKKLDCAAKRDDLTGLYNRRVLFSHLEENIMPQPEKYYITMLDIDNFKSVNDTYGHAFGDTVLKGIAIQFLDNISEEKFEISARYGGEEFVFVQYADSMSEAVLRINNIRRNISRIIWKECPDKKITISGGIVKCAGYGNVNEMMKGADELLYYAKTNGKNKIASNIA